MFRPYLIVLTLIAPLSPTVLPAVSPVAVEHFPDRIHALI